MKTWRHGDMGTWRHRHGDTETRRHGDMAWTHGDMDKWAHGHINTWNMDKETRTWTWRHGQGDVVLKYWGILKLYEKIKLEMPSRSTGDFT